MNKHIVVALTSLLVALTTVPSSASLAGSGGSVEFTAVGPAGLKINGRASSIVASEEGANVSITVPLAQLDTGIGLRNDHMRTKYLETQKYPNAVLTVPRAALPLPAGGSADVMGQLTLHGKTKPVKAHCEVSKDGSGYAVKGSFRVSMTEYGIEQPSFAGATVKPDVDVHASFHVAGS